MALSRSTAISIFALPFALAFVLYATGALKSIDEAIERKRLGIRPPPPGPTRDLSDYAGWWEGPPTRPYGSNWISRIIVRAEGKKAYLRMWYYCAPNYCEAGEFQANVYGDPPARVYALEVARKEGEILRIVTLGPNGNDLNMLVINEARRAKDPNANQSSATGLKRVK